MKKKIIGFLCIAIATGWFFSCSNSSSGSGGSGAASLIPNATDILKATLPSSLISSAVTASGVNALVSTDLQTLKDRIFSPGPVDFLYRIDSVDSRLVELADSIALCNESGPTATLYNPPVIATGFSFPMMLSCKTTIDATSLGISDMKVYFGKSAGYWYVATIQTNSAFETSNGSPPTMATLAKIDVAGNTAEIYQISSEKVSGVYKSTILHIIADKASGIFEISTASSAQSASEALDPGANYSGVGCGVKMKTNGSLVYATGSFNQLTSCPTTSSICADSALADTTGCTGVVDSFSVLDLSDRSVINDTAVKELIVDRTWLTGL